MSSQCALLVIDMQIGMFEKSEKLYRGDAVVDRIAALIERARRAAIPVFFVHHQGPSGHPLERGSPGSLHHPRLQPTPDDPQIAKTTPDAFAGTELKRLLDDLRIGRLWITGIQTEYCIDTTCRRASSLGYETVLVGDAHTTWNGETLQAADIIAHHNEVLGNCFADVRFAEELPPTTATATGELFLPKRVTQDREA